MTLSGDLQLLLEKGGPVVWVLLGYSLLAMTLLLERLLYLLAQGKAGGRAGLDVEEAIRSGSLEQWLSRSKGPERNILEAIYAAHREGITQLGRVATRVGSYELQRMERGFRTLAFLGNTAPLLGLFGTITGMIKAFMVIESAGGRVDAQALAGGIWEAMVTTGVGLAVSVPILFALHLLEGAADRRAQSMRACASSLLERLGHHDASEPEEAVHHRDGIAHAV